MPEEKCSLEAEVSARGSGGWNPGGGGGDKRRRVHGWGVCGQMVKATGFYPGDCGFDSH